MYCSIPEKAPPFAEKIQPTNAAMQTRPCLISACRNQRSLVSTSMASPVTVASSSGSHGPMPVSTSKPPISTSKARARAFSESWSGENVHAGSLSTFSTAISTFLVLLMGDTFDTDAIREPAKAFDVTIMLSMGR